MGSTDNSGEATAAAIQKVETCSEHAHCAARNVKTLIQAIEENLFQFRRMASEEPQLISADGVVDRVRFIQRMLAIASDEAERAESALEAVEVAFFDIPTGAEK